MKRVIKMVICGGITVASGLGLVVVHKEFKKRFPLDKDNTNEGDNSEAEELEQELVE